ncbi:MAG: MlaD family protein [FCB group bacterium]|jgi:ABC-type transporter Mla subunit MlaD|nr:MlaD family protein [FCB group bacterium]
MPEKKHSFTRTEIKAGLMVLTSAAVLLIFTAAVLGLRPPTPVKVFYADFINVKGLHEGNEVFFGGRSVGRVLDVAYLEGHHSKLRVAFDVLAEVPVNAGSVAKITQTTLTSENHLEITTGKDEEPLIESGTLIESQEGSIFDLADKVGDEVNELLGDVRDIIGIKDTPKEERVTLTHLSEDLQEALDESTEAIKSVREIVEDNREEAERIIKKVQDIEDSAYGFVDDLRGVVEENRAPLKETVESAREAADRVAKATERLEGMADTLEEAMAGMKDVSGNAADLVHKSRPVIEEFLLDLRETIWHMKEFSRTIAEQPESVLRGATPQGRKP